MALILRRARMVFTIASFEFH